MAEQPVPYVYFKQMVNGVPVITTGPDVTQWNPGTSKASTEDILDAMKQRFDYLKKQMDFAKANWGTGSNEYNLNKQWYDKMGGDAAFQKIGAMDPKSLTMADAQILKGAGIPMGGSNPISEQDFLSISQGGAGPASDEIQAVNPLTGQLEWMTTKDKAASDKLQADIKSGAVVQVAPGRYAPKGSAAASNPLGVNTAVQGLQQQLASGKDASGNPLTQDQIKSIQQQITQSGGATGGISGVQGGAGTQSSGNQTALDIINNSQLDPGQKMLFSQIAQNWDPSQGTPDPSKMLAEFQKLKSSTVDPYFQEQIRFFTDDIQSRLKNMETNRGYQLEQEKTQSEQNIKGAKENLEARGMTFSGQGMEQLGALSAYKTKGQPGGPGTTPIQFGGPEGLVPQANRLMSSASSTAYQKSLQDLSRSAEQELGTKGSVGLVPGVSQLGSIEQSATLPGQRSQAEAGLLQNLYGQSQQNVQGQQPLKPFSS